MLEPVLAGRLDEDENTASSLIICLEACCVGSNYREVYEGTGA